MSPEFFIPEKFNLKDNRQTKCSDCYAFGMVIYEVLSGRLPFSRHGGLVIIGKIIQGKRPRRPRGQGGKRFTDDVWCTLECCWKPNPCDRPSIEDVLMYLEEASRSWAPPSPQSMPTPIVPGQATRTPSPSTEGSTDESEVPSPCRSVPSQSSQKGDLNEISIYPFAYKFSAFTNGAPDLSPDGSDSEGSAGILDRVSRAGILNGFWY